MFSDFDVSWSHLFCPYADLNIIGEDRVIPPKVVSAVADFVLSVEAQDEGAMLHGVILGEAIQQVGKDIIHCADTMDQTLADMDYHKGRHYLRDVGKAGVDFARACAKAYEFANADIYTTRETPMPTRRICAHYCKEMQDILPEVMHELATADQAYDFDQMSRFYLAVAY